VGGLCFDIGLLHVQLGQPIGDLLAFGH
jgi:hypothetical protein